MTLPTDLLVFFLILAAVAAWLIVSAAVRQWRSSAGAWQKQALAEARARALLDRAFTAAEVRRLEQVGFLEVESHKVPGRTYRILPGRQRVRLYDGGECAGELCIQPARGWLPDSDMVLIHKVMLEADEAAYLHTANLFWTRAARQPGGLFF